MGTYSSITSMVSALAGLGIGSSGVRQIAEASSTGDQNRIARTSLTIRRSAMILGLAGTFALIILANPIGNWTFGNSTHTLQLVVLSLTVFFGSVSSGQMAIVQGVRNIADLARLSILGALLGAVIAILLMVIWREKSIVPILVVSSGMAILTSWHYSRKIEIPEVTMSWRETWSEARPLLKLGSVFAFTALMASGVAFLTRVVIIRSLGLDAAGLYSAAWTLSSLYVGFILGAMGADFYPRLSAVAQDHMQVNRLVNEQTEVALLLSLPGLVATLSFAPWVLHLMYSAEFAPAGDVLRWQVLGLVLRVLSWPMGFIILAKGNSNLFFWSELASNVIHLGLIWMSVKFFGLAGTGIAFFALYVFHVFLMVMITKYLTGFRWSASSIRLIILTTVLAFSVFLSAMFLSRIWASVMGSCIACITGVFSLIKLTQLTGINPKNAIINKLKAL